MQGGIGNFTTKLVVLATYLEILKKNFRSIIYTQNVDVDDVDVDVEKLRAQAYASMPASYIANYIYCTIANF